MDLKKWASQAYPFLFVLILLGLKWDDTTWAWLWLSRWNLFLSLMGLTIGIGILKKDLVMGGAFIYFLGRACYDLFEFQPDIHVLSDLSLYSQAISSVALLLAMGWFVGLNLSSFKFPLQVAAGAVCVSILLAKDPLNYVSLFHNPSMAATYVALIVPSLGSLWVAIPYLGCILLTHTRTAWAALFVAYVWKWMWGRLLLVGTGMSALAYFFVNHPTLNGRLPIWKLAFMLVKDNPWTGRGAGSFPVVTPYLQNILKVTDDGYFFWAHNDWLQIWGEYGTLGLALAVAVFIRVFVGSNLKGRCSVLAFGTAMLTNMPMHYPLHSLWGIILVNQSLRRPQCKPIST